LHRGQLICQATTIYVSTEKLACSKSATPNHILGVALYNCYASGVAGVLAPPPMVPNEYVPERAKRPVGAMTDGRRICQCVTRVR